MESGNSKNGLYIYLSLYIQLYQYILLFEKQI